MTKNGCETTSQALLGVHISACNITNKINYEKIGCETTSQALLMIQIGCETTSQAFFVWT